MGYVKFINREIDRAFNLLQDIPVMVTLVKRTGRKFDFKTGKASDAVEETFTLKTVILETDRKDKNINVRYKRLLLKREHMSIVGQYDIAILNSEEWTIGDIVKDEVGFVVYLEIYREVK